MCFAVWFLLKFRVISEHSDISYCSEVFNELLFDNMLISEDEIVKMTVNLLCLVE